MRGHRPLSWSGIAKQLLPAQVLVEPSVVVAASYEACDGTDPHVRSDCMVHVLPRLDICKVRQDTWACSKPQRNVTLLIPRSIPSSSWGHRHLSA